MPWKGVVPASFRYRGGDAVGAVVENMTAGTLAKLGLDYENFEGLRED